MKSVHDTFHLIAISDVHHAQSASDEDLLIQDLQRKHPKRLFIGIGDELDSISRADKRHKLEDLKDKFCTKKTYPRFVDAEIEDYADIVSTYTKKEEWLGHISGNHPLVMTENNLDPVQRLCNILDHPYLGYSAFVPITITYGTTGRISMMIMCHHGFGGGSARKEGASLNSFIDHSLRYEAWDLALYGHRHDRWVKMVPRIRPQSHGVKQKSPWVRSIDRVVCQCGTYLRTLSHGEYPTYSEKMGFPPRPLGCVVLEIGIKRILDNGMDNLILNFIGSNV